jgi:hypothetical protein
MLSSPVSCELWTVPRGFPRRGDAAPIQSVPNALQRLDAVRLDLAHHRMTVQLNLSAFVGLAVARRFDALRQGWQAPILAPNQSTAPNARDRGMLPP